MPLQKGKSRTDIAKNIHELMQSAKKRPQAQIVAIALSMARKGKK